VVFAAASSLTLPECFDQQLFGWVARIILDGGAPYKDAWEVKGPLAEYIYALAVLLFGREESSIRILDLAAVVATCWCVRSATLHLSAGSRFGANSAVIFFALVYYGSGGRVDATALPDGWASMIILAAMALLLRDRTNLHGVMMAVEGALVAVATLIKPTYFLYILLPLLYPISKATRVRSLGGVSLATCLMVFISVIAIGLFPLYEADALGDFGDVLRWLYTTYSASSDGRKPITEELIELPRSLISLGLLLPFVITMGMLFVVWNRYQKRQVRILGSWFALGLLVAILQGRYWQEHFLTAVTAGACIFGASLASLWQSSSDAAPRATRCVLVVMIWCGAIAIPAVYALNNSYDWPAYMAGYETREQYVRRVAAVSYPDYVSREHFAKYMVQHSTANDRFFVWGNGASFYAMSRRKSVTRFAIPAPMCLKGPLLTKYRDIFLQEIRSRPPEYVIVETDKDDMECLAQFAEFNEFLEHRYSLVDTVNIYQIRAMRQ